jgi:DDE family transposase
MAQSRWCPLGFSTKIHLKTDFEGLPIAFHLTGGEASDSRNFETLLDIGPDVTPRVALGDKGYDSKSNREAARPTGFQHRCGLGHIDDRAGAKTRIGAGVEMLTS